MSTQAREPIRERGQRLATFERPGGRDREDSELRVVLDEVEGHRYIGVRVWQAGADGQYYPTKSGITIRRGELPEFIEALGEAQDQMGNSPAPQRPAASRGRQEPDRQPDRREWSPPPHKRTPYLARPEADSRPLLKHDRVEPFDEAGGGDGF